MVYPTHSEARPRFTPFAHSRHPGDQTFAVVPAYDEGRCIGSVVLRVKPYVDRVLVVDDGSSDDTAKIAEAAGATVLRHEQNRGKGCALNTGLARARQLGAKAVVLIDGDGQHRAEEIPDVLGPVLRGEADVVVGSRYLQAHQQVPRHRVLGHKALNWLTNAATGVQLSDTQNGFRALSDRAVAAFRFSSQGFSVESEMQFLIREHQLRCAEAPVTALYPDKPKRSVVAQGLQVLDGLANGAIYYRPLELLLLPGLCIAMIGFAFGMAALGATDAWPPHTPVLVWFGIPTLIIGAQMLFTGMAMYAIRVQPSDARPTRKVETRKEDADGSATQERRPVRAAPDQHYHCQP
jgi:glycosyltransferase involved in cell wall biosynthesis